MGGFFNHFFHVCFLLFFFVFILHCTHMLIVPINFTDCILSNKIKKKKYIILELLAGLIASSICIFLLRGPRGNYVSYKFGSDNQEATYEILCSIFLHISEYKCYFDFFCFFCLYLRFFLNISKVIWTFILYNYKIKYC
jgi:hypothetical protein